MVLFILKQNLRKIKNYFRSKWRLHLMYRFILFAINFLFIIMSIIIFLWIVINVCSADSLAFLVITEWCRIINCSSYLSCTARIKLRDCKLGWHNKTRLYVPLGKWGTKPSCVYGARDTSPPLVIILNEMKLVHSTHAVDNKTSVAVACFEVPRIFHVTAILVLHWRSCCNTFVPFEIGNSCKYLPLASAENFTIAQNYI